MIIDKSAYQSLEISKILEIIRRDCRSDLGARRLVSIEPACDMEELIGRQELFRAVEAYRDVRGELPWSFKLSSVGHLLEDAKNSGMLLGEELLLIRTLLCGSQRMKDALSDARREWPVFSLLLRDLRDFTHEEEALSILDDDGRLQDRASEKLRHTRERMRAIRDQIRRKGQHVLNDPSISGMLQERVLTLRNGRHAVLVRQDALPNFPGIVIDRSGSGNSIYMEPHSLVGLNNEYSVCVEDESAEERRILHRLTEKMLSRAQAILDAERVLGQIDLFYALSEKIRRDRWHMPILTGQSCFNFRRALHPLLEKLAVPVDISCGENFRVLVVTGPNTGGKTVALKTAGVCVSLGWLGFPTPSAENSVLGKIDDIYSDIGDEQSIEQNLSTFSAHISQITKILSVAAESSVILLDELGAGTDPDEGAALGIAILDALREKNSLVLATTHHNPIKHYALTCPDVESASVEFDTATLSPTYRILVGIPGRSNALLIAEKLGMPDEILHRAHEAMRHREVSMEDIIGELQEKRTSIEQESGRLEEMRLDIERTRAEYEAELRDLMERRDTMLENADKKALGIVENAETSARSLIKTIEESSRQAASKKLEQTKKHFSRIKEQVERREDERLEHRYKPDEKPLEPGDRVVVTGMTKATSGILSEIRGDKAVIAAGVARMEMPIKMLRRATSEERNIAKKLDKIAKRGDISFNKSEGGPAVKISLPPSPLGVPSSIMIRGMTLDEAMPMAEQYLDRAYRAGYGEVTVIHGRGTGTLRREVHSLCKTLPYVDSFRLGEATEGGIGITIVRFKR
ncbi:MAG: Smr/MutS family protein [Synergistaceae bacterium]|jgi:DNA mismatch repair protein MutS2|nr:Smr/MutS family protein [Synergistaceae bacterium]